METLVIQQVDSARIVCLPQIRKVFSEESVAEMADSIRAVGILQPIRVRRDGNSLIVEDGERRLRAALLLGLKTVPVLIVESPTDTASILQRQLILNAQREDLSPIEQAEAIDQLMKESGCTAAEVSKKIGKSQATIAKLRSLLLLTPEMQQKVAAGEIGLVAGHQLARGTSEVHVTTPQVKPPRKQKLTAVLDSIRKVIVEGVESTMDAFIDALETLLSRCKAARKQGIELPTFLAMLRDQADR